jgi:hypothetical protein
LECVLFIHLGGVNEEAIQTEQRGEGLDINIGILPVRFLAVRVMTRSQEAS